MESELPSPSIVCLQEVFTNASQLARRFRAEGYTSIVYDVDASSFGLSSGLFIASRHPIRCVSYLRYTCTALSMHLDLNEDAFANKGALATLIEFDGSYLIICNTHLQSKDGSGWTTIRRKQIDELILFLHARFRCWSEHYPIRDCYLVGDTNISTFSLENNKLTTEEFESKLHIILEGYQHRSSTMVNMTTGDPDTGVRYDINHRVLLSQLRKCALKLGPANAQHVESRVMNAGPPEISIGSRGFLGEFLHVVGYRVLGIDGLYAKCFARIYLLRQQYKHPSLLLLWLILILVFGILAGLTHLAHGLVSFVGSLFRMRRIGFYQADGSYEEFESKTIMLFSRNICFMPTAFAIYNQLPGSDERIDKIMDSIRNPKLFGTKTSGVWHGIRESQTKGWDTDHLGTFIRISYADGNADRR